MKKEFIQFFRNWPLIFVVIFAVVLDPYSAGEMTFDLRNYSFAVFDMDRSDHSADLITKLRQPFFRLVDYVHSYDQVNELLTSEEAGMVIIIPAGFERAISSRETADIQVVFDGANANSATIAVSYLSSIVEEFSNNIMLKEWKFNDLQASSIPQIDARFRSLYNENLIDRWFIVIAEFLNAITLISVLLPAAATVYEKQTGTMEQLTVTPLKVYEIMFAKILPMSLVIIGSMYLGIYLVIQGLIGAPMRGSIIYFTIVTLVFLFTTSGLGMLIATIAKNLAETILLTLVVLIPMVFLSGAWTPPEAMPQWLQGLINFSPLKYYLEISYGIFFRGSGFVQTWQSLSLMGLLGLGIFSVGALRFRKSIT